jgi:hypothetical protein
MNAIPPLIFYVVGAALVVGGTLRTLTLGRRRPASEVADDDPARERTRRRHFLWGIIWVLLGLFLIGSTAGVLRSKAPPDGPAVTPADRSAAPVIRFEPARPPAPSVQSAPAAAPATNAAPPAGR